MILLKFVVGPLEVNCYIIASESTREATVIDAGDEDSRVLSNLKDNGLTLKYIINTHGHFDHIGGNRTLKDATGALVLMHRGDVEMLQTASEQAEFFGIKFTEPPLPDMYVDDGDEIIFGDIKLKVIHTPGHSKGGICLLSDNMVFTGDTLFAGAVGRTDFPGGNFKELLSSVRERLMILPDDTIVLPGHGPESTIRDEKEYNPFVLGLEGEG
ncbi:MAG: MBL fold metallo-hydrolase [Nitrospirota bacterium]